MLMPLCDRLAMRKRMIRTSMFRRRGFFKTTELEILITAGNQWRTSPRMILSKTLRGAIRCRSTGLRIVGSDRVGSPSLSKAWSAERMIAIQLPRQGLYDRKAAHLVPSRSIQYRRRFSISESRRNVFERPSQPSSIPLLIAGSSSRLQTTGSYRCLRHCASPYSENAC